MGGDYILYIFSAQDAHEHSLCGSTCHMTSKCLRFNLSFDIPTLLTLNETAG